MADWEKVSVGAMVSGTDKFGESFEGEVLAFDIQGRLVVIKSRLVEQTKTCDVMILNMDHASFNVVQEATGPPKHLASINFEALEVRKKKNIDKKMTDARYMGDGVTDTAQSLMSQISRLYPESEWNAKDIIVMGEITVSPPYQRENCRGPVNSKVLEIVQQTIEKFHKENGTLAAPTV